MRAATVQASLRGCAGSPEPSLLAHTSSESRGTFRQKARSLAPLNGWACAVKVCHDGMLEDTNSLDGAQFSLLLRTTGIGVAAFVGKIGAIIAPFSRNLVSVVFIKKNTSSKNLDWVYYLVSDFH